MKDGIIFYPWSEEVLNESLSGHDNGEVSTLDLELTAKCSYASCIYCDSRPEVGERNPNELSYQETEKLLEDGSEHGLRWVYTCGLGEPLEDPRFKRFVEKASALGVRISLFTNGILIDEKMAKWLHDNKVGIILKMDTFDEKVFDKILGKKGAAAQIYKGRDLLLDAGYGKNCGDGYTDLAFSIVPTRLNIDSIDDVIKFANENNIFSSVGELEHAGRVLEKEIYSGLGINKREIVALKKRVEKLLWKGYTRPICPTIITGLHIDNVGNCVVDSDTGLNCKWFLLREPYEKILGNVRKDDLLSLFNTMKAYRKNCFNTNTDAIRYCESVEYVFGGCGGDPRRIIEIARQHL